MLKDSADQFEQENSTTDNIAKRPVELASCLVEIEEYVSSLGWDMPGQLFALVKTKTLLETEPALRGQITETVPDGYSSIAQEDFHTQSDLTSDLEAISWPATVDGCALATERSFLAAGEQIPEDLAQAAEYVANHPERQDLRIVAGVLRDGSAWCVARLRNKPEERLEGDLVPALTNALAMTLR